MFSTVNNNNDKYFLKICAFHQPVFPPINPFHENSTKMRFPRIEIPLIPVPRNPFPRTKFPLKNVVPVHQSDCALENTNSINYNFHFLSVASGHGAVGRAVASNIRDWRFESQH